MSTALLFVSREEGKKKCLQLMEMQTGFHGQGKFPWDTQAISGWEVKLTLNCCQIKKGEFRK